MHITGVNSKKIEVVPEEVGNLQFTEGAGRVRARVKEDSGKLVDFLRRMIASPSVSGEEAETAGILADEMRRIGFDEVRADRLGNVIGRVGNGPVKILYDAHMDTVPAGDPGDWGFDPLAGKYEDGVVYGRGASDDKGPLAAMVYGAKAIKDLGLDQGFTLYVVGVVAEEVGEGLAISHTIEEEGVCPDFVVIGEASELRVCRGHRGRAQYEVTFSGKACHASAPQLGDNALYKAARFILEVEKLNERLKGEPPLGKGSVSATVAQVKTPSVNTIPGEAKVLVDRRLAFEEGKDLAIKQLESLAVPLGGRVQLMSYEQPSYTGLVKGGEEFFPPWLLAEDHPLIQTGAEAVRLALEQEPVVDVWGFSTDGNYTAGKAGIPTLGFGPGEGKYCHSNEDQMSVEHLEKAAMVYAMIPQLIIKK